MPIREYECDACGRRFEKIQKNSDPPIEVCPHCGGHVHKLMSSPAIQFKGTGWYITDYARKDSSGAKTDKDSGEKTEKAASKDSKETASSDKDSGAKKSESTTSASTTESTAKPSTD